MNSDAFFYRLRAVSAHAPALIGSQRILSYRTLVDEVDRLADVLRRRAVRVLASQLENEPSWAIVDLAALRAGVVHVPLPGFFSAEQCMHVLHSAGVDAFVARSPQAGFSAQLVTAGETMLTLSQRAVNPVPLPAGTAKITFTSGTTAAPKGVCLSAAAMLGVAQALTGAMAPLAIKRHLAALPLPMLLENLAGLYAGLLSGAAVIAVRSGEVGLQGSSEFEPALLDDAVERYQADSVIVLPQMLRKWTAHRLVESRRATSLKFVAVGGAALAASHLERARAAGLPAYEGYGLSEASSVTTLNLPGADRPGTVGRALPHARLRVQDDGEIEVAGALMLGYLSEPPVQGDWVRTGDLGSIDADGFVTLTGRRKNVLITAYGRNISAEWVESQLEAQAAIGRAVVFGEGAPRLSAVVWPALAEAPDAVLAAAIARANEQLPDYARVASWVRAAQPFSAANGQATANGRPRRESIYFLHQAALASGSAS